MIEMCWDCAAKLGIKDSLLPIPRRRQACPYCGTTEIGPGLPTNIQWASQCWPIALGNAFRALARLPYNTGLW